eukprot:316603-Prorocentrum_minimum.AAC.4
MVIGAESVPSATADARTLDRDRKLSNDQDPPYNVGINLTRLSPFHHTTTHTNPPHLTTSTH